MELENERLRNHRSTFLVFFCQTWHFEFLEIVVLRKGILILMEHKLNMNSIGAISFNNALQCLNSRDIEGAELFLEQALLIDGDNALYLKIKGLCKYIKGQFVEAKMCWMKVLSLDEEDIDTKRYLSEFDSEDFKFYLENYNKCIGLMRGNPVKAIGILKSSIEQVPNVKGYELIGLLYYRLGLRKSALIFWKKALNMDISNKTVQRYISVCKKCVFPLIVEKAIVEVLLVVGKLKLL